MKNKINAFMSHSDLVFWIAGIIIFVIFLATPFTGDDAVYIKEFGTYELGEAFIKAVERVVLEWHTWSSRILINYTCLSTIILGRVFFAGMNGLFTYVLLKAISVIFKTETKTNIKITCLFFLFPFSIWSSAGWYATIVTYYWPVVTGIVALIPIAKHMRKESMRKWEYIIFSLALIYCANTEQGMVFILLTYSVFCILCLIKRIFTWYFAVQEFLAIASMIAVMLNPGNKARKIAEVGNWFPDYGMLSIFDKIDMGVSTTLHTLLFSNYILIIAICGIILSIIYKMYKDFIIRFFAGVPLYVTVLLGPLRNILFLMFPQLNKSIADIPKLGVVNVNTYGYNTYFIEFFLLAITCILLIFDIVLIYGNKWQTYLLVSLLLGGAAGRFAMGLSPTIYASGIRTFSNLLLIFVVTGAALSAKNDELKRINSDNSLERVIYVVGGMLGVCNLAITLI